MNTVVVMGRLTRAPEMAFTTGGKPVARMRLAIPRPGDDGAEFVDTVAYDGLADACGLYLARGRRVGVVGRLVHEEWDAPDGSRRERVVIVARDVEFIDAPPQAQQKPAASVAA